MTDICIIGAGPAGSTFATRMAQLGHTVHIIERATFPRPRLGESLSPGVAPLLATIGAGHAVEQAGRRIPGALVAWDTAPRWRADARQAGAIVDRGAFDRILLERARAAGARVLQPANVVNLAWAGGKWTVDIETDGGNIRLLADFVAHAGGRDGGAGRPRRIAGPRTIALHAYWRGANLPTAPCVEAGEAAWFWGVPLPDGAFNALAFVDLARFRADRSRSAQEKYLALLASSRLLAGCLGASQANEVRGADATPYLDGACVTASTIRIGDAALAIDPLSSSGVQKAIQSALAGAVVANTLLRRPESADAARRFYESSLSRSSDRHSHWAAGHYRLIAAGNAGPFWRERAVTSGGGSVASVRETPNAEAMDIEAMRTTPVQLSLQLEFTDLPCIDGEFVTVRQSVVHPDLPDPLTFLDGHDVASLLRGLPAGLAPVQIAQSWSRDMPLGQALAAVAWLVDRGVLARAAREHVHADPV